MKFRNRHSLAVAVSAAFASGLALAQDTGGIVGTLTLDESVTGIYNQLLTKGSVIAITNGNTDFSGSTINYNETDLFRTDLAEDISKQEHTRALDINVRVNVPDDVDSNVHVNVTDVQMVKALRVTSDLALTGTIDVDGVVPVESAAIAVIDDKQLNGVLQSGNQAVNTLLRNTTSAGDNVLEGATGNIGLNLFSGDFNMQDNAVAIAGTSAAQSAGMIDAEIFVQQIHTCTDCEGPGVINAGVLNTASLGNNALANASGNIGVNLTAGHNNMQKNNLAAAVGSGVITEANVNSQQESRNNWVVNTSAEAGVGNGSLSGHIEMIPVTLIAAPGDINGGRVTEASGSYSGDETGNFAGEISGTYSSNHNGDLEYDTNAIVDLGGVLTGEVPVWVLDSSGGSGGLIQTENRASLSNDALLGASGNIGVNVSAGTGNLQANNLSLAASTAPLSTGTIPSP